MKAKKHKLTIDIGAWNVHKARLQHAVGALPRPAAAWVIRGAMTEKAVTKPIILLRKNMAKVWQAQLVRATLNDVAVGTKSRTKATAAEESTSCRRTPESDDNTFMGGDVDSRPRVRGHPYRMATQLGSRGGDIGARLGHEARLAFQDRLPHRLHLGTSDGGEHYWLRGDLRRLDHDYHREDQLGPHSVAMLPHGPGGECQYGEEAGARAG